MTRLTKQGVRNLDPSRQKNGRQRTQDIGCIHADQHSPCCPCQSVYVMYPYEGPCIYFCNKCGRRRDR